MVKVILVILSLTDVHTGVVPADKCEALARAAVREKIGDRAVCVGAGGEFLFAVKADDGQPT